MKRKIISLLMVVMMLAAYIPASVYAETSGTCGDDVTWSLTDGTLTISGSGDMTDFDWSNTPPWYTQRASVTKAIVENGVTSLGDLAFAGCVNLSEVSIPDTIKDIGSWAFDSCESLTDINIPQGVERLGKLAFWGCISLTGELILPDSISVIEQNAFMHCGKLTRVVLPKNLTELSEGLFEDCTSLTDVVIPDSVTNLSSAFVSCIALKKLPTLPKSLKNISESAFSYCSGLTSLDIPDHIESIDAYAFQGCSGLTEIVIPETLKTIGEAAFSQCSGLVKAVIPNTVESIGNGLFISCVSLSEVSLPDHLTNIPDSMFFDCGSLAEIDLPENITSIGYRSFRDCYALNNIVIPGSVTSIDKEAFYRCNSLTNVSYDGDRDSWAKISIASGNNPLLNANISYGSSTYGDNISWNIDENGVLIINGTGAIPDGYISTTGNILAPWCDLNDEIVEIEIGDGITSIGAFAFYGLDSLTKVTIPTSITTIGDCVFNGCVLLTDIFYAGDAIAWNAINKGSDNVNIDNAKIHYNNGEGVSGTINGISWSIDNDGVLTISGNGNIPDFSIGESEQDYFAPWYYYNKDIVSIKIEEGITRIGDYAFYGLSLVTDVDIPDSVTSIGDYAFSGIQHLQYVTLSSNITSIENYPFFGVLHIFFRGTQKEWNLVTGGKYTSAVGESVHYEYKGGKIIELGSASTGTYWYIDDLGNLTIDGSGNIPSTEPWKKYYNDITNIVIGDGISKVADYIFTACPNVKTITVGSGVTSFGMNPKSFLDMYDLETIYWNAIDVEDTLGAGEFYTAFLRGSGKNNGGVNIIFGDKVKRIPDCFHTANVKRMVIPSGLTKIDGIRGTEIDVADLDTLFEWEVNTIRPNLNNRTLYINGTLAKNIVIPDYVTSIPDYIFYGCLTIENVTMGNNVTSIGNYAFYNCDSLDNVSVGNNVTSIGKYAFYSCPITKIIIPKNVTFIGSNAISYGSNMSVYYGGTVYDWESIEGGGINNSKYATMYYEYRDVLLHPGTHNT